MWIINSFSQNPAEEWGVLPPDCLFPHSHESSSFHEVSPASMGIVLEDGSSEMVIKG